MSILFKTGTSMLTHYLALLLSEGKLMSSLQGSASRKRSTRRRGGVSYRKDDLVEPSKRKGSKKIEKGGEITKR